MKAAVMEAIGSLVVKELEPPVIKENEVLVRVKACSVCSSDLHSLKTGLWMPNLPTVLGHEVSGVIAEKGKLVEGLELGDHVALEPNVPCRKCTLCKKGLYHLCQNTVHIGNHIDGGFAEYVKIHYLNAYKISKKIKFEYASLMEPIGVCLQAVRRSRLSLGESVLIVGDGPFGMIFVQLCRLAGAAEIYISGRRAQRLAIAEAYGAKSIHSTEACLVDEIGRLTGGKGVDVVMDASGSTGFFKDVLQLTAYRGRIVLFSYTKGQPSFDITPVHLKELEIIGSVNNPNTFEDVANLLDKGQIDLDRLITEKITLEQLPQNIYHLDTKKETTIKSVVVMDNQLETKIW